MYSEEFDNVGALERNGDDVFSKPVRAGKRTYFFDVKATKGNDYYLTITESKRRMDSNGHFAYDKDVRSLKELQKRVKSTTHRHSQT